MLAGAVALVLSVLAAALGEPLRGLTPVPWAALAGVAVLDLLLSMTRRKALNFEFDTEAFIGETATLTLRLSPGAMDLRGKLDYPEGLSGPSEFTFSTDNEGRAEASIPCRAVRRGVWRLQHLWLIWPSRLGLLDFVPRLDLGAELRVVPNIRLVQSGKITSQVVSALFGVKENRAIGEGSEFHQLRDFVQGMDVKSIDWKRSARRRSLVAKELRAERNHHVIIAFDTGYQMREEVAGLPRIDHAVTAGLATAWAAAVGGDLVGYFSYDVRPRVFSAPSPGRSAFARLRSWTAELSYQSRETNHTLALTELNARTPKRSLIIIFTDFVDATSAELLIENTAILAKRHVIIFVTIRDPDTEALVENAPDDMDGVATLVAANQSLSERQLVHERLARLGVTIVDAKPNTVTARLISAYLDIKAQELI